MLVVGDLPLRLVSGRNPEGAACLYTEEDVHLARLVSEAGCLDRYQLAELVYRKPSRLKDRLSFLARVGYFWGYEVDPPWGGTVRGYAVSPWLSKRLGLSFLGELDAVTVLRLLACGWFYVKLRGLGRPYRYRALALGHCSEVEFGGRRFLLLAPQEWEEGAFLESLKLAGSGVVSLVVARNEPHALGLARLAGDRLPGLPVRYTSLEQLRRNPLSECFWRWDSGVLVPTVAQIFSEGGIDREGSGVVG